MLDHDARSLEPLGPRKKVRLHLCLKQHMQRVVCLNIHKVFQYDNASEFKSDMTVA